MQRDRLRRTLLDHSDHRACRAVWQASEGDGEADPADYAETLRVTGGAIAVVGHDGAARIFARWVDGRFEHLTLWPPSTVGGLDHTDAAGLEPVLADLANLRPIPHDETPFAHGGAFAAAATGSWP